MRKIPKKPVWGILLSAVIFCILILLAGAALLSALAGVLPRQGEDHPVARITLDGDLIQEIDLEQVGASFTFTVTGEEGLTNTILVEQGRIRVIEANCPDQVCVDMGPISGGYVPIACVPHELVIDIISED